MIDESMEQKRQKIIESFEREQKVFEKAYEDSVKLLNKSFEAKNLAGIDQAKKNMEEASEILGDLVKGKNQALDDLQKEKNPTQAAKEENLSQDAAHNILGEQKEIQEKSEEEDHYYGYGM